MASDIHAYLCNYVCDHSKSSTQWYTKTLLLWYELMYCVVKIQVMIIIRFPNEHVKVNRLDTY